LKEKDKRKKEEKRKAKELGLLQIPPKKIKVEPIPSDMKVVIDLTFDELMTDAVTLFDICFTISYLS